jgi:hypothetical protein
MQQNPVPFPYQVLKQTSCDLAITEHRFLHCSQTQDMVAAIPKKGEEFIKPSVIFDLASNSAFFIQLAAP